MAAIVASVYPDVFAAAGVHSGLPVGAASNVIDALGVMKRGVLSPRAVMNNLALHSQPATVVRTIVFHGDADSTVNPHNGDALVAAVLGQIPKTPAIKERLEQGESAMGQAFTRSIYQHESRRKASDTLPVAEYWRLHNAGHAWSGGDAAGSYTDPKGVDATAEMLRFFFERPVSVNQSTATNSNA